MENKIVYIKMYTMSLDYIDKPTLHGEHVSRTHS